ncbi:MAG TPA: hypothetical protein VJB11_01420 [archaeon]|nr:hypothetical protein [archaeon]
MNYKKRKEEKSNRDIHKVLANYKKYKKAEKVLKEFYEMMKLVEKYPVRLMKEQPYEPYDLQERVSAY